ncbi:MAG: AsmA family protein [Elusimicrobiaceae bacterium]|nr:AsmA family protein [Elusimicrobiaceae bacterium]
MKEQRRQRAKKRLFARKTKRFTKASCLWIWRLVLLVVMLVLLIVCVAWVLFLRAFNAQHISEELTQRLQKQLNRPVMISSLELKFLNALELKGFMVVDTVGEPGRALVSADSVTLRFEILPLFEQKLIIREVILNNPRFNLVRTKQGEYNIPQVHISHQDSATDTNSTGKKFETRVEDWRIKEGVFNFKDLQSGASHALYGFNAHFDNLRFNELSHFDLEMVLRNQWEGHISELEIEADGQIDFADFDWKKFALRDLKTQVYLFKKPVDITLNVDDITNPSFTLVAKAPAFEEADVSVFGGKGISFSVPDSTLEARGTLTDNYTKLTLPEVTVKAADVKLTANGSADFAKDPWTLQANFSTETFALAGKEKYYKPLARYKLTGKGSLSGKVAREKGKITLPLFTAKTDKVSGDIYGFLADKVSGEFQAKTNFTDLYARTKEGKVTVARSVFDKLQLSASWRKGNLYAYIGSGTLNEVPVKLSVDVANLKQNDRKIKTHFHFATFDPMAFIETVKDFVTVIVPLTHADEPTPEVTGELAWLRNFRDRLPNFMPNLAGTLSADAFSSGVLTGQNFNAEFDFTGLQAGGKHLSGPLKLRLQKGVIHQMEKWAEEQEALNVTFQPFIMMHRMERAGSFSVGKVLRDVEVTDLGAWTDFTNGNMQVHNAYTVGPTISAAISGWTDWVNETFDLTIYTMFTNTSKSGVLAENLTDESGNPALAFRLSSAMKKPKTEMLRAKKAGKTIQAAQEKGVGTQFEQSAKFIQGDYHATK